MDDAPDDVLRIAGLDHAFGEGELRSPILHGIDLAIRPGELVIMTGPSGCGKTTLLTLIGGLRRVQEGSLRVLGRELHGLDDAGLIGVRRKIGFIFQAHNLFESLTAMQNVRMALELEGKDAGEVRRRASQALTDVGLAHRLHYKPRGLSGGQRQRVAIARALANRPRLILADEPTAALDAESTRIVMEQMQGLRDQGSTILVVTHDVKILNLADRVISMAEGRIKSNVATTESIRICMFLSKCPAFATLKPEALAEAAKDIRRERFAAGSTVIREHDEGDKFYVINRGTADVLRADEGGDDRKVGTLAEGDSFGEAALLGDRPRNASVVANEDLEVYTLDKTAFQRAVASTSSFREQLLKIYFQRQ